MPENLTARERVIQDNSQYYASPFDKARCDDIHYLLDTVSRLRAERRWQELPDDPMKPPFDGKPVLILTDHKWTNSVHRVIWTDEIHGEGIYGWAVDDCKHGPYPLHGYLKVLGWQPLPAPPADAQSQEGERQP